MVIRKYIAINEEEATKLAKEDLGQDVVILNVKNNSKRGFLGIFKKPSVEITAAVDEKKEEESVPDFSKLQEAIKETNAVLAANEAKVANEVKKEEKKMRDNLQVGDEIVTIGGIYGRVLFQKRMQSQKKS